MVLTKEDFSDLTIVELLQNVTPIPSMKVANVLQGLFFDYNHYCEKLLFEKWRYHELPTCRFILNKIKEQKSLYNPAPADSERYLEFLHGLKIIFY